MDTCPNCDIKLNEGDIASGMCGRCDWLLSDEIDGESVVEYVDEAKEWYDFDPDC